MKEFTMNAIQKSILGIVSIGVFITGCATPGINATINTGDNSGNTHNTIIFNGNQSKQEMAENYRDSLFKSIKEVIHQQVSQLSEL